MTFIEKIKDLFTKQQKRGVLRYGGNMYMPDCGITQYRFGETLFLNGVQLLSDLYSELYWETSRTEKATAWRRWVSDTGQRNILRLFRDGYIVVGYKEDASIGWGFYDMPSSEYTVTKEGGDLIVRCQKETQYFYVLLSPTYSQTGYSDYYWCKPFIKLADAALNSACTTSERLGAYIVLSPETNDFGGTLTDAEKDAVEVELEKEYGALSKQKQVMLLSRTMRSQVVNLAGVDLRMQEKVKSAILGMADRLKIPANQIAFIDSTSSKTLANGGELREGDMAKYRTFRRLMDATYYKMAHDLGIFADYRLENEPLSIQGQKIEQQ